MEDIPEIKELFHTQKLAVLATQSRGQPHGSLVAFACSDNLKCLFFATDRNTRKYRDIRANPRIAMLIDNRSNRESDFQKAIAVTAKGTAHEVKAEDREMWTALYLEKHPQLADFTREKDVALLKIDVDEYLIARFDSTQIIRP